MINFEKFTLENGMRFIVHEDKTVSSAVLNILYDVGSKDENPEKTGFAHLFEHLMFGGSKNAPEFDGPLQAAGGENNAFTSPDITNYYDVLPAENIETAFWLESDRMRNLSINSKTLEVQRKVVIEEFYQRYLNQPYGDVWLLLRPLAYKAHPYQWATIGKEPSHIEGATLEDVQEFYDRHYSPNNAIAVVAGNIDTQSAKALAEKWFGEFKPSQTPKREFGNEPTPTERRFLEVERNVPQDALYMAFPFPDRKDKMFRAADLLSDWLGHGKSSLLYERFVKANPIFSQIQAYHTGSIDRGLLIIEGKLLDGLTLEDAESKIWEVLEEVKTKVSDQRNLEKLKNRVLNYLQWGGVEVLNRAMNLASFELLGNAAGINQESEEVRNVSAEQLHSLANEIFQPEKVSVLYYKKAPTV